MDDARLAARARRGDTDAYAALVRLHQRDAVRLAWLVGGDAGEADDVVQEAFVRAWQALDRFRPGAPFRPWLLRIVANEARNRRRARVRRASLALRHAAMPAGATPASPEERALVRDERSLVAAALDRLPEHERLVLACRYLLDLSEAETATALDLPRGTVKSRTSRGLDRLRADLEGVDA